jgi:excisionase family DNA binding protein
MSELDKVRAKPTIDVRTAARLLGIGQTLAYTLAQSGELAPGVPVLRLGRKMRVPSAALLRALAIEAQAA